MPGPGLPGPPLNPSIRTWNAASGSVEQPGAYTVDPALPGGAGSSFLAAGVYDFRAVFTQNGGFISNELRPPDEPNMVTPENPNMTTLRADLTGARQTSIAVNAFPGPVPQGSVVSLWGGGQQQPFTVSSNASAGANATTTTQKYVLAPNATLPATPC